VAQDDLAEGTVERWSDVDGWGVLRSAAVDGPVFAHRSMIRDRTGDRRLTPGQPVWFRWELPGQDGCDTRASAVWRAAPSPVQAAEPPPEHPPSVAYRSTLTITFDGPASVDDPATPAGPQDGSPPPRP